MPSKEWQVNIDGRSHTVRIEHGAIIRRQTIFVDGAMVSSSGNVIIKNGHMVSFNIGEHVCTLIIKGGGFHFNYDLLIDNYSIEKNQLVKLPPELKFKCSFVSYLVETIIIGVVWLIITIISDVLNINIYLLIALSLVLFILIRQLFLRAMRKE